MYPILDAHTHVYPERIALRAATNLADFYHFTVAESGTFEGLLACDKKAGIGGMLLLPVATSWKNVDKINDSAAAWADLARRAGFLAWAFGSVNAECPDLTAVLAHIRSLGLRASSFTPICRERRWIPPVCTPFTRGWRNGGCASISTWGMTVPRWTALLPNGW